MVASTALSTSANTSVGAHQDESSPNESIIAIGVMAGGALIIVMLVGYCYFRSSSRRGIAASLPQETHTTTLQAGTMRIYVGLRTPLFDVASKLDTHIHHMQDPDDPTTYPPPV